MVSYSPTTRHVMSWSNHIHTIATQAHQKLGFLRRNLKGSPLDCKKLAYVALVHSALEYEHHMGSIPSEGRGRRGQS